MGQLLLLLAASFPQAGAASLDLWEARVGKDFRALTALAAQTLLYLLRDKADSKDGSPRISSTGDLPVGINCCEVKDGGRKKKLYSFPNSWHLKETCPQSYHGQE